MQLTLAACGSCICSKFFKFVQVSSWLMSSGWDLVFGTKEIPEGSLTSHLNIYIRSTCFWLRTLSCVIWMMPDYCGAAPKFCCGFKMHLFCYVFTFVSTNSGDWNTAEPVWLWKLWGCEVTFYFENTRTGILDLSSGQKKTTTFGNVDMKETYWAHCLSCSCCAVCSAIFCVATLYRYMDKYLLLCKLQIH